MIPRRRPESQESSRRILHKKYVRSYSTGGIRKMLFFRLQQSLKVICAVAAASCFTIRLKKGSLPDAPPVLEPSSLHFRGVSGRCFFEASTNVPGYMSSGCRLLLHYQTHKKQSPGCPSALEPLLILSKSCKILYIDSKSSNW